MVIRPRRDSRAWQGIRDSRSWCVRGCQGGPGQSEQAERAGAGLKELAEAAGRLAQQTGRLFAGGPEEGLYGRQERGGPKSLPGGVKKGRDRAFDRGWGGWGGGGGGKTWFVCRGPPPKKKGPKGNTP